MFFTVLCRLFKLVNCLPSMSRWQTVSGAIVTVDLELLDAVHALQSSKTLEWNLGCAGDKLEELCPVGLIKRTQSSPEPLDLKEKDTEQFEKKKR